MSDDEIEKIKKLVEQKIDSRVHEDMKSFDKDGILKLQNRKKDDAYIKRYRDLLENTLAKERRESILLLNEQIMPLLKNDEFDNPLKLEEVADSKYKNFIVPHLLLGNASVLRTGVCELLDPAK